MALSVLLLLTASVPLPATLDDAHATILRLMSECGAGQHAHRQMQDSGAAPAPAPQVVVESGGSITVSASGLLKVGSSADSACPVCAPCPSPPPSSAPLPPTAPSPPGSPPPVNWVTFSNLASDLTSKAPGQLSRINTDGSSTSDPGYISAYTTSTVTAAGVGIRFQCATTGAGSHTNSIAVSGSGSNVGSGWKMIGFQSGTAALDGSYNTLLYGIACAGGASGGGPANSAYTHFGGTWSNRIIPGAQPYTSSMVFEVKLSSVGVEWYLNGGLVRSEQGSIPYPLFVKAYVHNQQDPALFNIEWV